MQANAVIKAEIREANGKGGARALRRDGKVPAIIYGEGEKNVSLAFQENEITREYFLGGFFSKLLEIKTDKESLYALPKDIQLHPVNDRIMHVDLLQVNEKSTIKALVPVHFLNMERCIGIKRGGNLNIVRHDLELVCNVQNIPKSIEIDIAKMNIGDSLHISHVELPEGVTPAITSRDFTIATIAGRGGKQDGESGEGEGAAEGEAAGDADKAA